MIAVTERTAPEHLFAVYSGLRSHFGYADQWWPGTPTEIALTAVLVQRCDWAVAWDRLRRLRDAGLTSLPVLANADPADVLAGIRGVAFAPTKSRRLVQFARSLVGMGFRDVAEYLVVSREPDAVRAQLLEMDGIGEETADCILLFAGCHPTFVIDAYTRRAFERLALLPEQETLFWAKSYGRLKAFFEACLLGDLARYEAAFDFAPGVPLTVALFRDFHAQLVELGRHHCLASTPLCRAQGREGWSDYSFCHNHCPEATCSGCPLVGRCERATSSATVDGATLKLGLRADSAG